MNRIRLFLEKSYKIIAYIAIIFSLIMINFYHIFTEGALASIKNVFIIIIGLVSIILVNKYIIEKLKEKEIKILVIIIMTLFLVFEILSAYFFKVQYNWDFKWVMDSAKEIIVTGDTENLYYFKIFPNNLGALIIVTAAMKIFFGNEIGAYIINIIFILLAALFAVLSAKKIGGYKLALNTMILLFLTLPLYLYSPIIYTDTLSVAFPVITLYCWLVAKEQKEKSKKKYLLAIILMTVFTAIGYFIKPVAAIVFVAIIIEEIFTNKKVLKNIAISLAIFLVCMVLFNKISEKVILKDARKNVHEYPLTHWIMMGLNTPESEGGTSIGYGAYSQKDSDYTATSGNYEEKKQANITKIKERLNNFGLKGYIKFIYKKWQYVWNDGTYYVLNIIGWDTINTKSIPYRIVLGDESNITKSIMKHFNNIVFFVILVGLAIDIKNKEKSKEARVLGISIVGIGIFLTIWEARSRYIYFMIPVFCVLCAIGIDIINKNLKKYIMKREEKNEKNISNHSDVL